MEDQELNSDTRVGQTGSRCTKFFGMREQHVELEAPSNKFGGVGMAFSGLPKTPFLSHLSISFPSSISHPLTFSKWSLSS